MSEYHPVIFVMIDGLRPDAIDAADCRTLRALRSQGAWSMAARSIMPSITLPCHMSIFHSVPPSRHGVTTNTWQPMARPLPGLIDQARLHDKRCAAIYNWEPLRDLSRPETLEFAWYRNTSYDPSGDDEVTDVAIAHLQAGQPDFAFVYLGNVDTVGHFAGWMSDDYLRQAERADRNLGRLLDVLPAEAHVLIHADHGGHERNHGTELPEDMTVPWFLVGPRVRRGLEITTPITLLDSAPTLATLLDIPVHRDWEGRCITEALQ